MKRLIFLALGAVGLLAGCNKESGEMLTDRVAAKFSEVAITRATATAWETGDRIGVYMVAKDAALSDAAAIEGAKNISHTVSDILTGAFTPESGKEIYFPVNGSAVDFYAYYPYQATMADGVYKVDVSDQSNHSTIDLMTATATNKTKSAPNVVLQFAHRLSKLSITASAGDGLTPADLAGLTVAVKGLPATADYNIATGTLSNIASTTTDIAAQMTGTDNLTAEAIVIPQTTIAAGSVQVVFSLTNGMEFGWNLTATALAGGSSYTYNIRINRTGVTLTSSNIAPWTAGNGDSGESGTANEIIPPFEVVSIPAGTFVMGSPADEPNRYDDEIQHSVMLTKGFKLSKYEITNAQYCVFLNANSIGSNGIWGSAPTYKTEPLIYGSSEKNGGTYNLGVNYNSVTGKWEPVSEKDDFPVIYVTWYGAMEYAAWAGGSLPTEAQWEYACRATTTTAYSFGADANILGDYAWYSDNASNPKPVGTKEANAWGLYDMHGNVWEWCADRYGDYPTDPVTDPTGAASGSYRVMRGGSWSHDALLCRSAYRGYGSPDNYNNNVGFRVALP